MIANFEKDLFTLWIFNIGNWIA